MNKLRVPQPIFIKTPLLRHDFQRNGQGPTVLLKHEFLQPSGSFKSRGIGYLIASKLEELKERNPDLIAHVFSSSGGNAGLAAAVASQRLGVPCTVVVSHSTQPRFVEKIRSYGAEVIIHGDHWKEADSYMKNIVMRKVDPLSFEAVYVHPFDNPIIWEGHSSIIDEIINSLPDLGIECNSIKGIVCSFGGGGLYNGLMLGLERYGLADKIPVICVETAGADVLNNSLRKGKQVEFEKISSCATSLGTASISSVAFQNVIKYKSRSVVVDDGDVISTCLKFSNDTNIITEPGCGATLLFGYEPQRLKEAANIALGREDTLILIGCGGSSTNVEELNYLYHKEQIGNVYGCQAVPPNLKYD